MDVCVCDSKSLQNIHMYMQLLINVLDRKFVVGIDLVGFVAGR